MDGGHRDHTTACPPISGPQFYTAQRIPGLLLPLGLSADKDPAVASWTGPGQGGPNYFLTRVVWREHRWLRTAPHCTGGSRAENGSDRAQHCSRVLRATSLCAALLLCHIPSPLTGWHSAPQCPHSMCRSGVRVLAHRCSHPSGSAPTPAGLLPIWKRPSGGHHHPRSALWL